MRRVAYIITGFPTRSETFIVREISALKMRGSDIIIAACHGPNSKDLALLTDTARTLAASTHYLGRLGAIVYAMGHPGQYLKLLPLARVLVQQATKKPNVYLLTARALRFTKWLRKENATQVHAHWPYGTLVARIASEMTNVPVTISVHAHEVAHEHGHFNIIFPHIEKAFFCNAAAMRFLLRQLPKAAEDKSQLIYHGVNTDIFQFTPPPSLQNGVHIVTAGRFTKTKRFDFLIRACGYAVSKGIDVRLTLIGSGQEQERLVEEARKAGIIEKISMPGWVPHNEMQSYYRDAHCIAILADTGYHDGLPNVVLEAMACGRPVIISELPAAAEVMQTGVNGFVIPGDDYEAFANVLRELSDPGRLLQLAKEARQTIDDHFKEDDQILSLKQCLDSV